MKGKKKIQLHQMTWCEICGDTVDYVQKCDKCDRLVCDECISTEYSNFSYWDGGVDIDTLCDICSGKVRKIHYRLLNYAV